MYFPNNAISSLAAAIFNFTTSVILGSSEPQMANIYLHTKVNVTIFIYGQ